MYFGVFTIFEIWKKFLVNNLLFCHFPNSAICCFQLFRMFTLFYELCFFFLGKYFHSWAGAFRMFYIGSLVRRRELHSVFVAGDWSQTKLLFLKSSL